MKELTKKEFDSTFTAQMHDVTNRYKPIVDVWEYIRKLDRSVSNVHQHTIDNRLIAKIYRNSHSSYDQILIPTVVKNIFLIIIVSLKNKNISGHYVLDLNKKPVGK